MLRHKSIDRVCCIVLAVTLLVTCLTMAAASTGVITEARTMGYETKLFDQGRVHTIDIRMDDWDAFVQTATTEEYAACDLVIDGERYANVAIRGKGNTSLTSVQQYGNNRYSFKVEFDHYQAAGSYYGLDKLSLNNVIQDNTYMKDYLAYTLMARMGVAAPLCSFVHITVNGESWGLYLAVEGVEDAFLARNYGKSHGELYKPDSMSFGGGRGNGMGFDMNNFMEDFDFTQAPEQNGRFSRGDKGRGGGMGADDVKLKYVDDDPASYTNIFSNAKTAVTQEDQARLIASLKALSEGDTSVVNADAVIRYLAVHDFLCNGDSYTGQMVHNYYLYEHKGVLEMIPWDYNLAFGGFQSADATSTVNSPIDSPISQGEVSDRPMVAWIFAGDETLAQYHAAYQRFVDETFASGWFADEFDRVTAMIAPYVKRDPTAFCTYEEFRTGIDALRTFCLLRAQSVQGQLDGSIPSTTEGQRTATTLVDAAGLDVSAMGSMGHRDGDFGGGRGGFDQRNNQRTAPDMGGAPPDGMPNMQPGSQQPPDTPQQQGGMFAPPGFGAQPSNGGSMQPPEQPAQEMQSIGTASGNGWLTMGVWCAVLAVALAGVIKFRTYR